jgi:hypothetical protein
LKGIRFSYIHRLSIFEIFVIFKTTDVENYWVYKRGNNRLFKTEKLQLIVIDWQFYLVLKYEQLTTHKINGAKRNASYENEF